MINASFNYTIYNRGRNFFLLLFHILRKAARTGTRGAARPINLWGENPGCLHEALLAVRMAANPGDEYEDAAATIEKEAAKYREFLRNPVPIGKISLNAKQLFRAAGGADPGGKMYQVRNPAEGQASVLYTFNRSDSLVLEFIVFDKYDKPLFPIVRTYSNWIGKRNFRLGPKRMFHLKMTEGDSPDLVRVQASFSSNEKDAPEVYEVGALDKRQPLAACGVYGNDNLRNSTNLLSGLSGWRLASLIFVECLVVSLIFGWAFRQLVPSRSPVERDVVRTYGEPPYKRTPVVFALNEDSVKYLFASRDETRTRRRNNFADFIPASNKRERSMNDNTRTILSTATATGEGINMGNVFCPAGIRCGELGESLKLALNSMRSLLAFRAGKAITGQSVDAPTIPSAPSDGCFSRMRVTLLPDHNLLLVREPGCFEYDESQAVNFVDNSGDELFPKLPTNIWNVEASLDSQDK
jgi:hypothetical protein